MILTNQEKNTIIAALTYYREGGQGDPDNRTHGIHNLATGEVFPNTSEDISLDDEGIEELIEKVVNYG